MSIKKISEVAERVDKRNEMEELNAKVSAAIDKMQCECVIENKPMQKSAKYCKGRMKKQIEICVTQESRWKTKLMKSKSQ